jgi:SAM-dependent methyltransferase
MLANHRNNPQFDLYMESELGGLKRSRAFIKSLCKEFHNDNLFFGKDCLDIGSSAGNTLITLIEHGADRAVGVEIEEGRYQTALININECAKNTNGKIQMFKEDIQNEGIKRIGQFDIIFCNDVLEHVMNPKQAIKQICKLLKNNHDAFAYVNLRNFQHPENIIHEPHYDFPGMTLLPHELAKKYYNSCRKDDALEYEVYHWRPFDYYKNTFESHGKRCEIYTNINTEIAGMTHIENESEKILLEFNKFSEKNKLDVFLKKEINKYINEYLSDMKKLIYGHRTTNDFRLLEKFYLHYCIVNIVMIVTNKTKRHLYLERENDR